MGDISEKNLMFDLASVAQVTVSPSETVGIAAKNIFQQDLLCWGQVGVELQGVQLFLQLADRRSSRLSGDVGARGRVVTGRG